MTTARDDLYVWYQRNAARRLQGDFERAITDTLTEWSEEIASTVEDAYTPDVNLQSLTSYAVDASDKDKYKRYIADGYRALYLGGAESIIDGARTAYGFGLNLPDYVGREIVRRGGTRIGMVDIEGKARERLFEELTKGRENGEAREQLARRIRDKITAGRYRDVSTRAKIIANTETHYAQNQASILMYQNAEGVEGLTTKDALKGPTDAECEERDGSHVTFSEAQAMGEHPNGTLMFVPRFSVEEAA